MQKALAKRNNRAEAGKWLAHGRIAGHKKAGTSITEVTAFVFSLS